MEGNSTDIKHAFNEAVAHRIEHAMLHARLRIAEEIELNELNKSTLNSYRSKALAMANKAGATANALDSSALSRAGKNERTNVPYKDFNYSPGESKRLADLSKKRFAGAAQARRKGATDGQ